MPGAHTPSPEHLRVAAGGERNADPPVTMCNPRTQRTGQVLTLLSLFTADRSLRLRAVNSEPQSHSDTPPGHRCANGQHPGPSHNRTSVPGDAGSWKPRTMKWTGVPGAPPSPSRVHRVKKINGHRERQMVALMKTGASPRRPLGLPCSGAQLSPGCHLPLCVLPGRGSAPCPLWVAGVPGVRFQEEPRVFPTCMEISREQPNRKRGPSRPVNEPRAAPARQLLVFSNPNVKLVTTTEKPTETVSSSQTQEKRKKRTPFLGLQFSQELICVCR